MGKEHLFRISFSIHMIFSGVDFSRVARTVPASFSTRSHLVLHSKYDLGTKSASTGQLTNQYIPQYKQLLALKFLGEIEDE